MVTNSSFSYASDSPLYYKQKDAVWVIVLADSAEYSGLTRKGQTRELPIQFCKLKGGRSVLEHTWDHAQLLANDERIITMALSGHQRFYRKIGKRNIPGKLIYQPADHGTAAAVYLALAHIMAQDPYSNVIILPTDDTFQPVKAFTRLISHALQQLINNPTKAALVCVKPTEHENTETKGSIPTLRLHNNSRKSVSNQPLNQHARCNSNIAVSRASLLWELCKKQLPDLFEKMEYVYQVILHFKDDDSFSNDYVDMATSHAFYHLATSDFIKDIILSHLDKCDVIQMKYLQWDILEAPEVALERKYAN